VIVEIGETRDLGDVAVVDPIPALGPLPLAFPTFRIGRGELISSVCPLLILRIRSTICIASLIGMPESIQ
jgi:hypothetical protein